VGSVSRHERIVEAVENSAEHQAQEEGETMNRKRVLTFAVGAVLAAAIAGGVAYATIPGPGNVYSACMLKGIGTIRLIDKSLPATNLMSRTPSRLSLFVPASRPSISRATWAPT
jgi:hypothetical protein